VHRPRGADRGDPAPRLGLSGIAHGQRRSHRLLPDAAAGGGSASRSRDSRTHDRRARGSRR
jgi:hypothetical protein